VLLFCQTMSLLPSPLKSPVLTIDQLVGTKPTPADWMSCAPFISQMRKWSVIAVLLLAAGLALYLSTAHVSIPFLTSATAPRPAAPQVPVSAAPAQRQDVPIYLTGLGTGLQQRAREVARRRPGRQDQLLGEGKYVKAGDVLVEIDPRSYEAVSATAPT